MSTSSTRPSPDATELAFICSPGPYTLRELSSITGRSIPALKGLRHRNPELVQSLVEGRAQAEAGNATHGTREALLRASIALLDARLADPSISARDLSTLSKERREAAKELAELDRAYGARAAATTAQSPLAKLLGGSQ